MWTLVLIVLPVYQVKKTVSGNNIKMSSITDICVHTGNEVIPIMNPINMDSPVKCVKVLDKDPPLHQLHQERLVS